MPTLLASKAGPADLSWLPAGPDLGIAERVQLSAAKFYHAFPLQCSTRFLRHKRHGHQGPTAVISRPTSRFPDTLRANLTVNLVDDLRQRGVREVSDAGKCTFVQADWRTRWTAAFLPMRHEAPGQRCNARLLDTRYLRSKQRRSCYLECPLRGICRRSATQTKWPEGRHRL